MHKKNILIVGLVVVCVFYFVHLIIGYIPVNNGSGFDGLVYLNYIQSLGLGSSIKNDPYRTLRMSGFLPLIAASAFGFSQKALIELQAFLNIGMFSIAAALFYDSLHKLKVKQETAIISVVVLVASWPFLVMPVFYPVLSDNVALAFSCVCLWCWTKSYQWVIYIFCAYFLWLHPGLFLIPFIFAAMPLKMNSSISEQVKYGFWPSLFFIISAIFLVFGMVYDIVKIRTGDIIDHVNGSGIRSGNGQIALPDLIPLSGIVMIFALLIVLWAFIRLISDRNTWKSISPSGLFFASLFIATSGLVMFKSLDWSSGMNGPPILWFMKLQSLAAPLKPLVSHFVNYGPVIILSILSILRSVFRNKTSIPKALLVTLIVFLPFLLFGSESRQWIGIFPIAVAVFALANYSRWQRICCLVFSLIVLFPAFWLKDGLSKAVESQLSFQSPQWQLYFGRMGPWMSVETYEIGLLGLIIFLLLIKILEKKNVSNISST